MDLKQTQVTDRNRDQFYKRVYSQQLEGKDSLINLNAITNSNIIAVDCCGWHYKELFPTKNVLSIDPLKTALEFKLPKDKIFKLVDNRNDQHWVWPKLEVSDCAIVFDRSPMLKYLTVDQLNATLNEVQRIYQPEFVIVKLKLMFVDSSRLVDRFYDIASIRITDSIVSRFHYNSDIDLLDICFRKKAQL